MTTPGRPHDPTLHPRTRPEAEEYALRNRGTTDWFRHDGKNVEQQQRTPIKVGDTRGAANAEKAKGEADKWFAHSVKNPAKEKPVPRCPTEESKACHDKIYGKEEVWFKHDNNKDFFSPRDKPARLTSAGALEIREKCGRSDSMDWYRHDHGKNDTYTPPPPKHRSGPSITDHDLKHKKTGDWLTHDPKKSAEQPDYQAKTRVVSTDAGEYLDRDRVGSAANWFGHDGTADEPVCYSPRVASSEGAEIANRLQGESESWFAHDAKQELEATRPSKGGSAAAKEMVERSKGQGVNRVLHHEMNREYESYRGEPRVKPEAEAFAKKSTEGMMQKYLSQDQNRDYQSARPAVRIKPEAQANAEKNKGMMGDCMGGYPAPAPTHNQSRGVRPEAKEIAQRNKGSVDKVMTKPDELPASAHHPRVKPEAAQYAERNKGTMGSLITNCGSLELDSKPVPRLKSQAAEEIAERNKGSLVLC